MNDSFNIFLWSLLACVHPIQLTAAAQEPTNHQVPQQILPDVFVWKNVCNTYVLRDGDAALLVDIGDGQIIEYLPDLGVNRVEWIVFSDHHRELCQGVERFNLKETNVAGPAKEKEIFESPTSFRKWHPKLSDRYSVYGASYVRPHHQPIKIDRPLNDEEIFKWRGWEIRCLDTPGHSPGGMTYRIQREGKSILLSGGILHDGAKMTNWFDTEWDYGFGKGIDALTQSVEKLIKHRPDWILPSHGPIIKDATQQLQSYLEKLKLFRPLYLRGYQVFDAPEKDRDSISVSTPVPMINRVTPHLYKLSPKNNSGKNFSIIISDSGKGLILDAGLFPGKQLDEIILGMREHLGLKSIDAFWISHMHGDHFLLGPQLKEKYGAEAWTLDRIADKCEHPRRYDYAALVSAYGDGFDGMKIDRRFSDGETINWEGYRIQIDWMPGQTEFGCCLWLEIDGKKIAFTGDNLFGNPANKNETGHEAVVARNSAIFEEGYLFGSRYLKELDPDIVMGSHSNVMPNPSRFLERYHAWSQKIIPTFQTLLPDKDYEYHFDPYWVSAYPYRVDFDQAPQQKITVTVRNFRDEPQRHRIALKLPKGIKAEPAILDGLIERKSRREYSVKLSIDPQIATPGIHIVPFDIALDGKAYGQLFDFIVRVNDSE